MQSKSLKKSVFIFGNYEIFEKVEAKDEGVNTIDDFMYQSEQFRMQKSRMSPVVLATKKTHYKNPKVIFHYFSPPGDLVEHPELLKNFKVRSHSEPRLKTESNHSEKSQKNSNIRIMDTPIRTYTSTTFSKENNFSTGIHNSTISQLPKEKDSGNNIFSDLLKNQQAESAFQRMNVEVEMGNKIISEFAKPQFVNTPKKKLSNLSMYSKSNSKSKIKVTSNNNNPENELSRILQQKKME